MIKVADLTRKGFVNGDISTVMSPLVQFCTGQKKVSIFKDQGYAFRITFLNKYKELEKKTLSSTIKDALVKTYLSHLTISLCKVENKKEKNS